MEKLELARSTDAEKQSQLQRLAEFQTRHAAEAPKQLKRLQQAVIDNQNVFEVLMDAVRVARSGRSPTPCLKWVGSTAATCERAPVIQVMAGPPGSR